MFYEYRVHTFGDREERQDRDRITMRTTHIVVDISRRHVQRMILLVSGGHRDCRLVRTEIDRSEHGPMSLRVLRNLILQAKM